MGNDEFLCQRLSLAQCDDAGNVMMRESTSKSRRGIARTENCDAEVSAALPHCHSKTSEKKILDREQSRCCRHPGTLVWCCHHFSHTMDHNHDVMILSGSLNLFYFRAPTIDRLVRICRQRPLSYFFLLPGSPYDDNPPRVVSIIPTVKEFGSDLRLGVLGYCQTT
jgi:hypothetical protein